jgi:hypothetical protein
MHYGNLRKRTASSLASHFIFKLLFASWNRIIRSYYTRKVINRANMLIRNTLMPVQVIPGLAYIPQAQLQDFFKAS